MDSSAQMSANASTGPPMWSTTWASETPTDHLRHRAHLHPDPQPCGPTSQQSTRGPTASARAGREPAGDHFARPEAPSRFHPPRPQLIFLSNQKEGPRFRGLFAGLPRPARRFLRLPFPSRRLLLRRVLERQDELREFEF